MSVNERNENGGRPRNVAVLGATGSIGASALDVIAASNGRLRASVLAVNRSVEKLVSLARRFRPDIVVVADASADRAPLRDLPENIELLLGQDGLDEVARRSEVDIVLLAIVGIAGLRSAWNALDAGKIVALANKEALVAGGAILTELLEKRGGKLFPVDSEHSAIYQCLLSRGLERGKLHFATDDVERLILTASGGPFRTWSAERIENATVEDALRHPTWNMGAKITVDSASTMNKALEIIEARWLFDMPPEKIQVVVHPQSIVHSMVEFVDGAVMAQLSPPDMRLPIQFALEQTVRTPSPTRKFDWTTSMNLEFFPPDFERFPAMKLGFEVAKSGGSAGVVLNAANEVAVDAFLRGALTFGRIPAICRQVLEAHDFDVKPTLARVFQLDEWARKETEKWISR